MRRLIIIFLLGLFAAFGAAGDLSGTYSGEWKSNGSGNGGNIHFKLNSAPNGGWTCDLTFALDGTDVKTVMREVKVQDGKAEIAYDFDLQGATLRSRLKGEWTNNAFRGSYETSLADGSSGVDSGTWTATPAK